MIKICKDCRHSKGSTRMFMTCQHEKANRVCLITGEKKENYLCETMRAKKNQLVDPPDVLCGPEGALYEAKQ